MAILQDIFDLTISGKVKQIVPVVQQALDEGNMATTVLDTMIEAMGVVGERFKNNEIFVPEMLISAKTMKKGVDVLKPHLAGSGSTSRGKIILGTVAGDLHDIGKNLVGLMYESAGFEVIDLGIDVPKEKFVETYLANPDAKIIALSALLTTTMPAMQEAVALLNEQDFRKNIKIMVGGAPVTQEFADEIGADAYTDDAASAAQRATELTA